MVREENHKVLNKTTNKKPAMALGYGAFSVGFRSRTTCLAQSSFCRAIARENREENNRTPEELSCLSAVHVLRDSKYMWIDAMKHPVLLAG